MNTSRQTLIRSLTGTGVAVLTGLASSASASALPDPGAVTVTQVSIQGTQQCQLARLGSQYVRCDNLTGAGTDAPAWITQQ